MNLSHTVKALQAKILSGGREDDIVKLLIAEDEKASLDFFIALGRNFGYEIITAENGKQAYEILSTDSSPRIALLDWMMPEISGIDVCKLIRKNPTSHQPYIIMITSLSDPERIAEALDAGADDYVIKPFSSIELKARISVGKRLIAADEEIRRLWKLIPICMYCKSIRVDPNYWTSIERFIAERIEDVTFSHGICPKCMKKHFPDVAEEMDNENHQQPLTSDSP